MRREEEETLYMSNGAHGSSYNPWETKERKYYNDYSHYQQIKMVPWSFLGSNKTMSNEL